MASFELPPGRIAVRSRVDHRAASVVELAVGAWDVRDAAPVREAADRIAARLLARAAGSRSLEEARRWAERDELVQGWVREAAFAVGSPIWVEAALREEVHDGWVRVRVDERAATAVLVAVRTNVGLERAAPVLDEVCARELGRGGAQVGRVGLRLARRLGRGTELLRLARLATREGPAPGP